LIVLSNKVVACARGSKLLARRRGEFIPVVVVVKQAFSFDGDGKNGLRTNVVEPIGVSRCSLYVNGRDTRI
jgi:hypothetical protein